MPFLPRRFTPPEPPRTGEFFRTPWRVHHLVLDDEPVMISRRRLWQSFLKDIRCLPARSATS